MEKTKYWNPTIETMSRKEIEELQLKKILAQVDYVYHYSPFYRKKFDEAGVKPSDVKSLKDMDKLPMTYKDDLRAERAKTGDPFGGALCVPLDEKVITINASTGTTGIPSIFAYTWEDLTVATEQEVRLKWMRGWRPGMSALITAFRWHGYVQIAYLGLDQLGIKIFYDVGYPLPNYGAKYVYNLKYLRPQVILAPTLMVYTMIEVAKKMGEDLKKLFGCVKLLDVGYGDIVTKAVKRRLEDETGIPPEKMYDWGGCADPLWYYGDCEMHAGNHQCDDLFLLEIRDLRTHELMAEGERGEVVVSNLFAKATPFLKWGTEDTGFMTTETCGCGRTHSRVTILGREAFAVNVLGKIIFPSEIENLLADIPGFTEWFTIYKYKPFPLDLLKMRIAVDWTKVKDPEVFKKEASEKLKQKLGVDSEIELAKSISELPTVGHKIIKLMDLTKKK